MTPHGNGRRRARRPSAGHPRSARGRRYRRSRKRGLDRGAWWGLLGGLLFAGAIFVLWSSSGTQGSGVPQENDHSLAYRAGPESATPPAPSYDSGAPGRPTDEHVAGPSRRTDSPDDQPGAEPADAGITARDETTPSKMGPEGNSAERSAKTEKAESPGHAEPADRIVYNPDEEPPERAGAVEYVEEASDPLVDPLAGRSDDSDEPFVNPLKGKRAKPDAGSGENRFFTLALSGTLEGKPIDPNDPQTWARLGYFLQRNSPLPFHLVYPGGYVPLVMKKGRGGRLIEKRPDENSPVPRGDRSNPSYKIVLDVSVRSAGDVKFYGKSLASKYISTLSGRIEKRTGGEFRTLERFSVSQTRTPSKDNPLSGEKLARTIYDVSLDQLVRKLKSLPPFAGP